MLLIDWIKNSTNCGMPHVAFQTLESARLVRWRRQAAADLVLAKAASKSAQYGTDFNLRALTSVSFRSENTMKWLLLATCAVAISFASTPGTEAKGCIKGAIVGGVAGHMAGHGKLGAAAGCAIGHHEANKADANKTNGQAPSGQK